MMQCLWFYVNYYQNNWSELLFMIDFAAVILQHEFINLSSFQVEFDYEPRTLFDWQSFIRKDISATEKLSWEQANQLADQIKEMWEFVWAFMKKTQTQQKKQADKHCCNIDFKIDDNVWVSIKSWKTECSNKKLDNQQNELYEIFKKIRNSYRLDLSQSIKMHSIFSPDQLWKTATDSLSEQIIDFFSLIEISSKQEWEVDKILTVRLYRRLKKLQYWAK